jgi:uncharacterized protein (DUF2461 family)
MGALSEGLRRYDDLDAGDLPRMATFGSMMRIYRDIRFSKDKSPYKTYAAAHFWHAKGKAGAAPAYYLHLEPGLAHESTKMAR